MRRRGLFAIAVLVLVALGSLGGLRNAGSANPPAAKPKAASAKKSGGARPAAKTQDTVLVRVGGQTITRREAERRLDELPDPYRTNYANPDGRQQFLDRLVEERVWLLGARKVGIDKRPEVRRQLEQAERDLLIRTYVNEVMAANPAPSDSEARVYYDAHVADYRSPATVSLSHILSKSESDSRRVKKSATGKEDWQKLVTRYSADTVTKSTGGSLGTVTREGNFAAIGHQPALAESAYALGMADPPRGGPGAVGGPYKTDRGWHVIKVDVAKPESTRPFEQMKSLILRQLSQSRSQDYYRSRLADEKSAFGLTYDSTAVKEFVSQKKTAQQLFREGQEGSSPAARIAAYRRLLEEYPTSEVSPQAQFMIGFVYSEELKNYEEAERAFQALLQGYPNSELAESARWMIEHMRSEDVPSMAGPDSGAAGPATKRPADKP